ncbi:MAG: hypothetical protein HC772_19630 [Leptolyngbyaceae cyanobacterium CRU_2_3]|nr:hypothetical protein [Leptolyngbyaceae cyanobacterium CRU_2_3]
MTNQPSRSLDALGQSAIALGVQQANHFAPLEEVTLQLDELTKQKLKRLSNSMSLSVKTIIESAINYAYAHITESKLVADDLNAERLPIGDFPFKMALSLETTEKLERLGMKQSISACAMIGINLLYDRLIPQDTVSHD